MSEIDWLQNLIKAVRYRFSQPIKFVANRHDSNVIGSTNNYNRTKKKKKDKSPLVVFIICEKFAQPGYEILSLST